MLDLKSGLLNSRFCQSENSRVWFQRIDLINRLIKRKIQAGTKTNFQYFTGNIQKQFTTQVHQGWCLHHLIQQMRKDMLLIKFIQHLSYFNLMEIRSSLTEK